MAIKKLNQGIIYGNVKEGGKFAGFIPLGRGRFGISGDVTLPGPGRDTLYVQGRNQEPELLNVAETPPGGLPSVTIQFLETYDPNPLRQARAEGRKVSLQIRWQGGAAPTNVTGWKSFHHFGLAGFGDESIAGVPIEYSGADVRGSVVVTPEVPVFEYFFPRASVQEIPAQVANANDVHFLSNIMPDVGAYPGPDKVGFVALAAVAEATANLAVTRNGGGLWANAATDPFAADVNIVAVRAFVINRERGARVVALSGTTSLRWGDFNWSDPATITWGTAVTITGNGQALGWNELTELLIATASGIYISEDSGESIARQLSSNGNITGIAFSPDSPRLDPYAYFFGASNTLLRKRYGSDTIEALVGPADGGAFSALAVALDGTIYAGNGTALYRSDDEAATAAGWTEVKDFGADKRVVGINCVRGDSEVLEVVVDDTTPDDGQVYVSADGKTFREVPVPANDGFNKVYFSNVKQFMVAVGDDDSTRPVAVKVAP